MNFIVTIWMHRKTDEILLVPVSENVPRSVFYKWVKKNGYVMIGEL